jgi:hypothetical protein
VLRFQREDKEAEARTTARSDRLTKEVIQPTTALYTNVRVEDVQEALAGFTELMDPSSRITSPFGITLLLSAIVNKE